MADLEYSCKIKPKKVIFTNQGFVRSSSSFFYEFNDNNNCMIEHILVCILLTKAIQSNRVTAT